MKKLLSIFSILCIGTTLSAQSPTDWKKYNYPSLGISFEMPNCGFKDEDDCVGFELVTETYIDDFVFTAGILSKYDEEFTYDHPYDGVKGTKGDAPKITVTNNPKLQSKLDKEQLFYMLYKDKTVGYVYRWFFKLNDEFYFMLMLEGEDQDFDKEDEEDLQELNEQLAKETKIINKALNSIHFYTPKAPVGVDFSNYYKDGPFAGKVRSKILPFQTGPWPGAAPQLSIDDQDNIYMMYVNLKTGVKFAKMSLSGKILKEVTLPEEWSYYKYALLPDGFVVITSKSKYLDDEQPPKNYFETCHILRFDFNGKLIWDKEIVPEITMSKSGDGGFEWSRAGCIDLKVTANNHLVAYYTRRLQDNVGIIHQGDGYAVLDLKGNIITESKWFVSHSFGQLICLNQDQVQLFALGDGYPRGINMRRMDSKNKFNTVGTSINNLFPFKGTIGQNYIGDTEFGNAISDGEFTYLVISTEENIPSKDGKANDLLLLVLDKTGKKVLQKPITKTYSIDEATPQIAFYKNNILVTWEVFDYYDAIKGGTSERFAVISKKGEIIHAEKPFYTTSEIKTVELSKMGNDISTNNRENRSNFVTDSKGNLYCVRILPLIYKDYMEITQIGR